MKMKHNKRRNTAFIFEALVRELTKASIKKQDGRKNEITKIIKEFFSKGTLLGRELELYKTLYETKSINKGYAEKILAETKRVYLSLNHQHIFDTQSKVISKINKKLGTKTFSNFVPNYKAIASISQIFNEKAPIKSKVLLENEIIKFMSVKPIKQKEVKLSNTALKMFAKKFNNTYDNLLQEQKQLLTKFISSFQDNGLELKIFLNEELGRIKKELDKFLNSNTLKDDTEIQHKTEEVLKVLDGFKGQYINEDILRKILKIQQLVKEIKTDE